MVSLQNKNIFEKDYMPIHVKRAGGVRHVKTEFNRKTVELVCVAVGPCFLLLPSFWVLVTSHQEQETTRTRESWNNLVEELVPPYDPEHS